MGYAHIENLYKCQDILAFKRCYALEKIHGTSAHVSYDAISNAMEIFPGGESPAKFCALFNQEDLKARMKALGVDKIMVFGEAYGGSQQGMSGTYGKSLKFIVFDIRIGECWLAVPQMAECAAGLGFEVVHFEEGPTDMDWIDAQRDALSVQAKRNGIVEPRVREGVVLRPPFEVTKNNGDRIIVKHKGDKFNERATPQKVVDPARLKVLEGAQAIADEWVTDMRLTHVLQKLPQDISMDRVRDVINAMVEDVLREAKGEIVDSPDARKAIGRKAVELFKARLVSKLRE
jgi:hypothetical protein